MLPSEPITAVVLGLAEAVVAGESEGSPDPEAVRWLSEQLCLKLDTMPRFLALGMAAMTAAFDQSGRALGGRPFHALPLSDKRRLLRAWRALPLSVFGDFVDFYEKMGVFLYWCWVEEKNEAAAHSSHPPLEQVS